MNNLNIIKIIISIFLIHITSCSTIDKIIYQPKITQGNLLNQINLDKLYIGMNKEQVFSILGTPMIQDTFELNTYHYIFYKKSHKQTINQKHIKLIFDKKNILISIDILNI